MHNGLKSFIGNFIFANFGETEKMPIRLLLVFPCYNESEILPEVLPKIFDYFENLVASKNISEKSRICFVDDGSIDNTWQLISKIDKPYVNAIKLSTNFGHQKALLAGLETFRDKFDVYITMDVDLQDDINVIKQMLDAYFKGNNIVYGVREDRSTDTVFKKTTAQLFYKLMNFLGVKIIFNHADFRLIDNKALNFFLAYKESHLFLRAIFPNIGLQSTKVYYKRLKRVKGNSKYPFKKMLAFAWDGITSFSAKPLKMVLYFGVFSLIISLILIIWASVQLLLGNTITGWFSIIILIIFFGGSQLFALGIIGEYIGKIFIETKKRPRYLIDKIIEK